MKTFVDNAGRTWCICINVAAVKRCRALVGVDLYGLVDQEFSGLGKLLSDPVSLVDVLFCLCKDEAEKLGVSDEDFGRAMAGDSIEHASDAFLAEFTDFFPDSRVRTGITKVLTLSRKVRDQVISQALDHMDEISVESMVERLRSSSGVSPEPLESTQVHLRSVS